MSHVTCHVSPVTFHMSRVTCHMSLVTCNFFFLPIGESYRWRVCFQRGLLCLVFINSSLHELSYFVKGEAVLKCAVVGVFLHDILGYGGIFQSLHQGVNYRKRLATITMELGGQESRVKLTSARSAENTAQLSIWSIIPSVSLFSAMHTECLNFKRL